MPLWSPRQNSTLIIIIECVNLLHDSKRVAFYFTFVAVQNPKVTLAKRLDIKSLRKCDSCGFYG